MTVVLFSLANGSTPAPAAGVSGARVMCYSSTVVLDGRSAAAAALNFSQAQAYVVRFNGVSSAQPSVVRGVELSVVRSRVLLSAVEVAAAVYLFQVNVSALSVVVANVTFGAQCVDGLPVYYRASAVAIVGNATVATAVSLSVWNSTLALQALAGVGVPQYDQTSFTSSAAMVLLLNGVQQEDVTVAVVASKVTAALLSSYAAFMPVFSLTAGIVVIAQQSLRRWPS